MKRNQLLAILVMAAVVFSVGMDWGLPSRRTDELLFEGDRPWSGNYLAGLLGTNVLGGPTVAADVDVNPISDRDVLVELTAGPAERAEIIARYRLYSYQPDEMITFRALYKARQNLDPKLYQYGGLFIYSVGAALKVAEVGGLVDLRDDLAFYLAHPEAFGRFYIVARFVVLIYGLMGVLLCYLLGRRLAGHLAGVLGALLFAVMPVTINMVHEAKPHLPAAVWMLAAVLLASWYVREGGWRRCLAVGAACGLAVASVMSAWPVWLILPAMVLGRADGWGGRAVKLAAGTVVCGGVFLLFNPFLVINLFVNRQVLVSNLANSAAMYRVGDVAAGVANVAALSVEAAGATVLLAGVCGGVWLCLRRRSEAGLLLLPAGVVLAMMAAVGAGKAGEFGRFGIFAYAVLALLAGCGVARLAEHRARLGLAVVMMVVAGAAWPGMVYLRGFCVDAYGRGSREASAAWLADHLAGDRRAAVGVVQEPAPYAMGPMGFAGRRVVLLPVERPAEQVELPEWLVVSADRREALYGQWWLSEYELVARFPSEPLGLMGRPTLISWANKPIFIFRRRSAEPADAALVACGKVPLEQEQWL